MRYYLAVDSGGTKVHGILYDEDYRPVRTCCVGSMRDNTTSPELVSHNIEAFIDKLSLRGMTISKMTGVWVVELRRALEKVCTIESYTSCGETGMGLAAAGIKGDGYCAIAGTGATMSCRWNGKGYTRGGYGSCVADEGSGYWIGREAFGAAIRDFEQRGEKTLLTDLISERFGYSREYFADAVYRIYTQPENSPIAWVASCAVLVSRAAAEGDAVAYDILARAGKVLGEQLISLPRCKGTSKALPVTVSGSVWRGHPVIFREFIRVLREYGMEQEVVIPEFEPIVGCILVHYFETHDVLAQSDRLKLKEWYKDFLFQTTQTK